MDAKSREELQKLRTDVPQHKRTLEEPFAAPSQLVLRRKSQGRLEDKIKRLTELEELERIETVQQNSVASGLVVNAVAVLEGGECPLCLEEMPPCFGPDGFTPIFHRYWCCGAICCMTCFTNRTRQHTTLYDAATQNPQLDPRQAEEYWIQLTILCRCPFCREKFNFEEVQLAQVERQAAAGKTWARCELGSRLLNGQGGVTKDESKGVELLKLAADDGDVEAMQLLSILWRDRCSENNASSEAAEKAKECRLTAARNGHAMAQHDIGLAAEEANERDALTWFTLAAAQGYWESQYKLGEIFRSGRYGMNTSVFTSAYWHRKAALQGHKTAQHRLGSLLQHAKAQIFDGYPDIVGYSVMPECCFWYDLSLENQEENTFVRPECFKVVQCGCCLKRDGENGIEIKRCSKCKAVGYCSRDCQTKHWKMGHKRDCISVVQWRESIKPVR